MEDYPRNLMELESRFSTNEACRKYLAALRWPDGFVCPRCAHCGAWEKGTGFLECSTCHYQVSVTAGTIFERTRASLPVFFRAIGWVVAQKNGASALGLQRILGLGTYKTAWTWLHKIRHAMITPGHAELGGEIEVDETYLGGLEEGVSGRQTFKKALIAVAAQVDGKRIGRIRMRRIPDVGAASLMDFVEASIAPGSWVHTDGGSGYSGLAERGYDHKITVIKGSGQHAHDLLPRVHLVVSLLKRWIQGTHQGAISPDHLDGYLDEFVFRFNHRASGSRGKLFYRLLQNAMRAEPAPYKKIIKKIRADPEIKSRRRINGS